MFQNANQFSFYSIKWYVPNLHEKLLTFMLKYSFALQDNVKCALKIFIHDFNILCNKHCLIYVVNEDRWMLCGWDFLSFMNFYRMFSAMQIFFSILRMYTLSKLNVFISNSNTWDLLPAIKNLTVHVYVMSVSYVSHNGMNELDSLISSL
jgi:hypothetical protein